MVLSGAGTLSHGLPKQRSRPLASKGYDGFATALVTPDP